MKTFFLLFSLLLCDNADAATLHAHDTTEPEYVLVADNQVPGANAGEGALAAGAPNANSEKGSAAISRTSRTLPVSFKNSTVSAAIISKPIAIPL